MSLAFALPDDTADLAQALEDAEPQAPKAIKPLLLQAARELRTLRTLRTMAGESAEALAIAASLRAGQMDSQSRHDEIANQVRLTLLDVAARLRKLA